MSTQHWIPSRYNVRATAEDGRLVLWNTLSGKITVFKPEDREAVLELLHKRGFEAPKEGDALAVDGDVPLAVRPDLVALPVAPPDSLAASRERA